MFLTNPNHTIIVATDALAHPLLVASDLITAKPFVFPAHRLAPSDRIQLQLGVKQISGSDHGTTVDISFFFDGVLLGGGPLAIVAAASSPEIQNFGLDLRIGNDGNIYSANVLPLDSPDPAFTNNVGINDNWAFGTLRPVVTPLNNFGGVVSEISQQAINRTLAHTLNVTATFNQAQLDAQIQLLWASLAWDQFDAIN